MIRIRIQNTGLDLFEPPDMIVFIFYLLEVYLFFRLEADNFKLYLLAWITQLRPVVFYSMKVKQRHLPLRLSYPSPSSHN